MGPLLRLLMEKALREYWEEINLSLMKIAPPSQSQRLISGSGWEKFALPLATFYMLYGKAEDSTAGLSIQEHSIHINN